MSPKHQHLTDKEKKQLKKQKKLEKKLKKEEKKRQIKRDFLSREVDYGELTRRKHEKSWKDLLSKIALPRMRSELEFAWNNFERSIDCKDFTISLLMDELRMSEEQDMHNFKAHCENIEKLMRFLKDRLDELMANFQTELASLEEKWRDEFVGTSGTNNENIEYLKTMLYQLELEKREQIRVKRNEYYSRLDEANVKNTHLLQNLKTALEAKYQEMVDDLQHFIRAFQREIRGRKQQHHALRIQDDSMQELIGTQFKQIRNLYDIIRNLKQKHIDSCQNEGARLDDLIMERQYFSQSFLALKAKLERDKTNDLEKLGILSRESAISIKCLSDLLYRGERILKLGAVCRKHETEREKIITFPPQRKIQKGSYETVEIIEGIKPEMELFWQRVGQIFAVHFSLTREKQFLTDENRVLIETHNAYCELLMYPEIKNYKERVAIPRTELWDVVPKYNKFLQNQ